MSLYDDYVGILKKKRKKEKQWFYFILQFHLFWIFLYIKTFHIITPKSHFLNNKKFFFIFMILLLYFHYIVVIKGRENMTTLQDHN